MMYLLPITQTASALSIIICPTSIRYAAILTRRMCRRYENSSLQVIAVSIMASPVPSDSDESSVTSLETRDPTLEELVEMLLASKRSLSSIHQAERARQIVHACRDAVEENAVLKARNTFVKHAISQQLGSLEAIRQGARVVEADGGQELKVC